MLDANDKKLVTESLWKKIAESGDTNIVGIGFGIAVKEGNTDLTRPWVVRFYVKQKRGGRHKFKITPEITVDIEPKYAASDGGKRKVTLLTDVTKVPTIEPAGRKLTIPGNGLVTSGIVLRWYKASGGATANQTLRLGVLTVAHDFKGIDPNRMVTIESPNNLLQPITGKRAIQSDPAKVGIDACLVTVEVDEAIKAGLLTDPLASPLPIKQYADLEDDRDKTGESRQADRTVSFRVLGTVGNLPVKMSGLKYGICYMSRGARQAFVKGTSGSLFEVFDRSDIGLQAFPSAIQIGAENVNFAEAYAQSLETVIDWLKRELILKLLYQQQTLVNSRIDVIASF